MKLIEKISNLIKKPKKSKILIKSRFGLPAVRVCGVVLTDNSTGAAALAGDPATDWASGLSSETVLAGDLAQASGGGEPPTAGATLAIVMGVMGINDSMSPEKIEDIYLKNNDDVKDLIINLNGVVTIGFGIANEQHETIRISYKAAILGLNALIKIYSFVQGDKIIFAQNSKQKKKYKDILDSMKISSVNVDDLVHFE